MEEAKRICEAIFFDALEKEKEHQKLEEYILRLIKELEKRKDEGSTEALDKMLRNQKHSKDIGGIGLEEGKSQNNKDTSGKEIQFTSSSESKEKQTFTVRKDIGKKTYVEATRN